MPLLFQRLPRIIINNFRIAIGGGWEPLAGAIADSCSVILKRAKNRLFLLDSLSQKGFQASILFL